VDILSQGGVELTTAASAIIRYAASRNKDSADILMKDINVKNTEMRFYPADV
jgi:hypothetical protein